MILSWLTGLCCIYMWWLPQWKWTMILAKSHCDLRYLVCIWTGLNWSVSFWISTSLWQRSSAFHQYLQSFSKNRATRRAHHCSKFNVMYLHQLLVLLWVISCHPMSYVWNFEASRSVPPVGYLGDLVIVLFS